MAPNTGKADDSNGPEKNEARKKPVVSRDYLRERTKGDAWRCLEHIIWPNVAYFVALHLGTLYGIHLACTSAKLMTTLFAILLHHISLLGMACAHRLWAHQSYKAALPLRCILAACHSMAAFGTDQNSILNWARRHRLHHRYWATNADPVNIRRGLFFAHCGWMMTEQHPDVAEYGDRLRKNDGDDGDLMTDSVVRSQHQYYSFSVLLMCYLLPTAIPVLLWAESAWTAYWLAGVARHTLSLNCLCLTSSVGHRFGARRYDVKIDPTDNALVSLLTLGEGHQNFHYTFPWDYSASEGGAGDWNCATFALNQLAKIGWVTGRRVVSREMIQRRRLRTGDKFE